MARIAGVNIPNHQHTVIGLTAIYGIGRPRPQKICDATGVLTTKKVKDLDEKNLKTNLICHLELALCNQRRPK
jgi:small subunit ribosomal protein S13